MCPFPIEYTGQNAGSEVNDILEIRPGQVVTYVSCYCILGVRHYPDHYYTLQEKQEDRLNHRRGVFVCWTGQGKMALMSIRDKVPDPSQSKEISESDFLDPGSKSKSTDFQCGRR